MGISTFGKKHKKIDKDELTHESDDSAWWDIGEWKMKPEPERAKGREGESGGW